MWEDTLRMTLLHMNPQYPGRTIAPGWRLPGPCVALLLAYLLGLATARLGEVAAPSAMKVSSLSSSAGLENERWGVERKRTDEPRVLNY